MKGTIVGSVGGRLLPGAACRAAATARNDCSEVNIQVNKNGNRMATKKVMTARCSRAWGHAPRILSKTAIWRGFGGQGFNIVDVFGSWRSSDAGARSNLTRNTTKYKAKYKRRK